MQATKGHARGHGHSVLLGDAHVENTVWELLGHGVETDWHEHCSGNSNNVFALRSNRDDFVAEHRSPGFAGCLFKRLSGQWVDLTNRVELVIFVEKRRVKTLTLLGDCVHDYRVGVFLCLSKSCLHSLKVVAINWSNVLDVKVREHALWCHGTHEPSARPPGRRVRELAEQSELVEQLARKTVRLAVNLLGANFIEVTSESTDGWSV